MGSDRIRCVGGPLDGRTVRVRTGDRFLAADRAAGKGWLYQRQTADTFAVCTDHDDSLIYPAGAITGERALDRDRLWLAGETSTLEIIAVDSTAN